MQGFSDCRIGSLQLGGDGFIAESWRVKRLNPSNTGRNFDTLEFHEDLQFGLFYVNNWINF
jgi:hypothetical protein